MPIPKILFTASGRRVELIEIFKKEGFYTVAADCSPTAPTLFKANQKYIIPKLLDNPSQYIHTLLDIVKKEKIQGIIPLIDPELSLLAKERQTFLEHQAMVFISEKDKVDIAFDKYQTYLFFKKIGLPTPETIPVEQLVEEKSVSSEFFPALLKPRFGSAGKGIISCNDLDHVLFLHNRGQLTNYVLQQKVDGDEITTDIFGNGEGDCLGAVQRKRLKIRAGEVERGVTVKYPLLFQYATQFAQQYKPFGTINIQCFFNKEKNKAHFIEINPRFGGGYPLAYHAGANFPKMIKQLLTNEKIVTPFNKDDYEEGLTMSRFDSAVYFKGSATPPYSRSA